MTRGQIILILKHHAYTTTEFNGDMYPAYVYEGHLWSGHGQAVVNALQQVNNFDDYQKFIQQFNQQNFGYPEQLIYELDPATVTDFASNYFDNWGSDFLYLKNLSGKTIKFRIRYRAHDQKIAQLPDQQVGILNFGHVYQPTTDDVPLKNAIIA